MSSFWKPKNVRKSSSMLDLSKLRHDDEDTHSSIQHIRIRTGDLITQPVDVIVVSSTSEYLFDAICEVAGDTFLQTYKAKRGASLISIDAPKSFSSKKIYILSCDTNSDPIIFRKSIEKFISDAIEKAIEDKYQSIAFPAIGCGRLKQSITLVAETMIRTAHRKLSKHSISISFVIQPSNIDVYAEFQKQRDLMIQSKFISERIGKGTMEVEKGDITTQHVDAIIISSSSDYLRIAIIKAAGKNVQIEYDTEHKTHPNATLIATRPGNLPCKQIFFVKWKPDSGDDDKLQQSLRDMILLVVQNVLSHNFTSIAFPAIGCGEHKFSISIVVPTIVKELKKQLTKRNLSWLVKFIIESNQQHIYDEFCKQVSTPYEDPIHSLLNLIPSTWNKPKKETMRFILSTDSSEYKLVISDFNRHMTGYYTQIQRIERIQNKQCCLQYLMFKKNFKSQFSMHNEKSLYHGCSEEAADLIIKTYFNRSFAGVHGTSYGKGIYFSSNAAYSHRYTELNKTGERCMFVARVLVGKTTIGNSSMKCPPLGFDSTTDGTHIFVIYHDSQAMAEYLITYK